MPRVFIILLARTLLAGSKLVESYLPGRKRAGCKLLGSLLASILSGLLLAEPALARNISPDHPSPYVRMHANDVLKWQVWDRTVLQRALKENKLILLSTGYYACHWCHVMRQESFMDKQVAEILNREFIPVKIDRELNPVLDAYLMEFLHNTQGYGGWPLNIFITPQGYPLTGLVYLPKDRFIEVLQNLRDEWQAQSARHQKLAKNIFDYSQYLNHQQQFYTKPELRQYLLQAVKQQMDELQGGFGESAKFPRPYVLMALLAFYKEKNQPWLKAFIEQSLLQMATQGLHDAIGGGFFRYSIDPGWQVPHFEKMLSSNAAMVKLYLQAYRELGDERWLQVARETLSFVIREMRFEHGYASSLNAQDAAGLEGGNYLWRESELKASLGVQHYPRFKVQAKLVEVGDEQQVLPVGLWLGKESRAFKPALMQKRISNPVVRDQKRVLSWNAYLLTAMVDMLQLSAEPQYLAAAQQLSQQLAKAAAQGLQRNALSGGQHYLEDYVFVAQALLRWQLWQGNEKHMPRIRQLLEQAMELFLKTEGWQQTDNALIPLPGRRINLRDDDLPAPDMVLWSMLRQLKMKPTISPAQPGWPDQLVDQRLLDYPLQYASSVEGLYFAR